MCCIFAINYKYGWSRERHDPNRNILRRQCVINTSDVIIAKKWIECMISTYRYTSIYSKKQNNIIHQHFSGGSPVAPVFQCFTQFQLHEIVFPQIKQIQGEKHRSHRWFCAPIVKLKAYQQVVSINLSKSSSTALTYCHMATLIWVIIVHSNGLYVPV